MTENWTAALLRPGFPGSGDRIAGRPECLTHPWLTRWVDEASAPPKGRALPKLSGRASPTQHSAHSGESGRSHHFPPVAKEESSRLTRPAHGPQPTISEPGARTKHMFPKGWRHVKGDKQAQYPLAPN